MAEELGQTPEHGLPRPTSEDLGWLLVGGSVISGVIALSHKDRDLVDWLVPLGLFGLGCSILLERRSAQMETTQAKIVAELDHLDPLARAQVLKAVAQEEISRLPGVGSTDEE